LEFTAEAAGKIAIPPGGNSKLLWENSITMVFQKMGIPARLIDKKTQHA
jgi:hypothetical protein